MEYGYGTMGGTGAHHVVLGGWKGELAQFGSAKLNRPACAPAKRCARRVARPDPGRMCEKCVRVLTELEASERREEDRVRAVPAPAVPAAGPVPAAEQGEPGEQGEQGEPGYDAVPAFEPVARQFVTVKRRECFVVHPYQRDIMTPPWPKRWGAFDLEKFYASLEPVTVIDATMVSGLKENACEEHGSRCDYASWEEARYIVLGGQHRTQEGGRVYGPDWEFEAVELLDEVRVTDLARRWWVTEDRRAPGTRVLFDKRVRDGVPEYVAMAEHLSACGFTWKRSLAARTSGTGLLDFTSIGTLPVLWRRDEDAARIMVSVLGRVGPLGPGGGRTTRMPLVRAVFEMARWDLRENTGTRVNWTREFGGMAAKIRFLGQRVTSAENAIGYSGETSWQRVANYLAAQYDVRRSTGYVEFPTF